MNATAVLIERPSTPTYDLDMLVKSFLIGYSSESTRSTYWTGLRQFLSWVRTYQLDIFGADLSKRTFEAYCRHLEGLGVAQNTQAIRFQAVRSWMQWLYEEEVIEGNPCGRVRGPSSTYSENLSWSNSHNLRDLRHAAKEILNADEHAAFALMAMCAMRVGEVGRADHEHVREQDYIHYLRVLGKGKKERTILLPPLAVAAVKETGRTHGPIALNRAGNRMSQANLARIVTKVAKKARLEHLGLTPHSLRRSWASITLDEGIPIRDVQRYLGHASVQTTQVYDRRPDDTLKSPAWTFQAAVA